MPEQKWGIREDDFVGTRTENVFDMQRVPSIGLAGPICDPLPIGRPQRIGFVPGPDVTGDRP